MSTPRKGTAAKPSPARPAARKQGAGKSWTGKSGAGKSGTGKSVAGKSGTGKSGTEPADRATGRPAAGRPAGKPPGRPAGKGRQPLPPPGPGLVVGAVPVLARVAGGLAVAGAVVRLVATVPPAASSGGTDLGGLQNVADLIPPLPLVVLVAAAGLLCTRGVLPRLGLAALLSAGTLSAGPLLRTLWLLDTGSRSTTDLPLGIATSARYEAGAGLVLLAVAYGLLVAAAVAAGLAWSRTVMEDDGGFDPRRPELAAWGLLVGIFAGLAFGMSPFTSAIGLDPGPVPERSGAALPGGLVLSLGAAVWAVVAATLRPRLAVVGAYAGLLAVLAAEALGTLLLVVRSPALGAGAGTVGSVLAVLAVAALLLAAAPVRPLARRPR